MIEHSNCKVTVFYSGPSNLILSLVRFDEIEAVRGTVPLQLQ
jgi:hypothetical protein